MNSINFTPFPNLTTKRLILRQVNIEDEDEFFILKSNAEILKYLNTKAKTIDEARQFLYKVNDGISKNKWILWGITQKNISKLIGSICLWNISEDHSKAEIGYDLMPNNQGRGIMQEAITTVIKYGFEFMKLHSIEACPNPNNSKSIKLLTRNYFIEEARYKDNDLFEGKIVDMVIYRLINPLEGHRMQI